MEDEPFSSDQFYSVYYGILRVSPFCPGFYAGATLFALWPEYLAAAIWLVPALVQRRECDNCKEGLLYYQPRLKAWSQWCKKCEDEFDEVLENYHEESRACHRPM